MRFAERVTTLGRRLPRWPVYAAGALPAAWLAFRLFTGGLGADPVKVVEHELGEWGLVFLIATLSVTPLRRVAGINLMKHRRALGLLAFFYVLLHLLTWVLLDMQLLWAEMLKDIYKRPYITVGMAGFAAMVPLAVTANNRAIRRMGASAWQRLHRLAYLAAAAGAIHYLLLVKTVTFAPAAYAGAVFGLLALRAGWNRRLRNGFRGLGPT